MLLLYEKKLSTFERCQVQFVYILNKTCTFSMIHTESTSAVCCMYAYINIYVCPLPVWSFSSLEEVWFLKYWAKRVHYNSSLNTGVKSDRFWWSTRQYVWCLDRAGNSTGILRCMKKQVNGLPAAMASHYLT